MTPWKVPDQAHAYQSVLDDANAYIEAHLDQPLQLEAIAAAAALSPFHFHRIFAALTGETLNQHIQRLRLERAANWLLKDSRASITQIALDCGFGSPSSFARSFKEHFNLTPGQYRARREAEYKARPMPTPPALPPYEAAVRVQELPERPVVYAANRGGYSLPLICAAWERLSRWAAPRGLFDDPDGITLGLSLDDPFITPRNRCRYYACIQTRLIPGPSAPVSSMMIAGGLYAVCRAECAAEEIESIYHALYARWLPGSGFHPGEAPTYEIYRVTPEKHPAGKFVLDVCLPVR